MRRKYQKFDMDREYLTYIKRMGKLKLAIVGRDPFPNGALQIPFLKETWTELDKRSAGYHLFNSLTGPSCKTVFPNPRRAAFELLDKGIVLLNASYFFLEKEHIAQEKHYCFVDNSLDTNYTILLATDQILLCGDASKMMNWVVEFDSEMANEVPHPSLQSKNSMHDKSKWDGWWGPGQLNKWITS